jgi:hypothetical protein
MKGRTAGGVVTCTADATAALAEDEEDKLLEF